MSDTQATPDLIGSVLNDMAAGPMISDHAALTGALLKRLGEKGLTLAQCADRRIMNRSLRTLEAYAREFKLTFPDYVPMELRPVICLRRSGDFYEAAGPDAELVAKTLGVVVSVRDDTPSCGLPVHSLADSIKALKAAGIRVKKMGRARV